MSKHLVELNDAEIERIAEGLSNNTWILDHSSPTGEDNMPRSVSDKALCDRLERLLPANVERAIWPDEVKAAMKVRA